jgi:hypothetical protein
MSAPLLDPPGFVARDAVTLVTPLGLRFRDVATRRIVSDGLDVRHTYARGTRVRTAVVTPSGVWALSRLPGLHDLETGAGDDAYWAAVPALARTFEIEVADRLGRYLPLRFQAQAPFRGLFEPACGSPLGSPPSAGPDIPLFSAPGRPTPPGFGIVLAQLREPSGTPAAWAALEVHPDGAAAALGMADDRGRIAVPIPYPEPSSTAGSPPRGSQRSLSAERWALHVGCRYDRSCPAERPPDLCDALDQAPATLDLQGVTLELAYGRELVLRTPGRSEVLVTAAASPP